jgi:hypothetical protein
VVAAALGLALVAGDCLPATAGAARPPFAAPARDFGLAAIARADGSATTLAGGAGVCTTGAVAEATFALAPAGSSVGGAMLARAAGDALDDDGTRL